MQAIAYLRTSSASNVGQNKDSEKRQREAIASFAASAGIEIVETFADPAVKGTDPIENRPGFSALLARIESNGVRTVLCEDSSRLARDMLTGELAIALLTKLGVTVLDHSGNDLTATDDPMKVAMRQIVQAMMQLEKSRLVAKLKHARDAKRAATGRCEGVAGYDRTKPELVAAAHALNDGRSLRAIAAELETQGYKSAKGNRLTHGQVARLLAYATPDAATLTGAESITL